MVFLVFSMVLLCFFLLEVWFVWFFGFSFVFAYYCVVVAWFLIFTKTQYEMNEIHKTYRNP